MGLFLLLLLIGALGALLGVYLKYREALEARAFLQREFDSFRGRYSAVENAVAEASRIRKAAETELGQLRNETEQTRNALGALKAQYKDSRGYFDRLQAEIVKLEATQDEITVGLYSAYYDFPTSDGYRLKLESVRNRQKELYKAGRAVSSPLEWTVGGSRAEGEKMVKQYSKLLPRAFDSECDSAVANVTWKNVIRMEELIKKAFETINSLGKVMGISITPELRDTRIEELRLMHEYADKKRIEAEEQRLIKERMREEERAAREFKKAQEDAEEDQRRYAKALERARAEAAKAGGAALAEAQERIRQLEENLREARERGERAVAQAQLTRAGYVYVISNIGSFGENVFKIGMTRRLEPVERIYELSDASVPFEFDIHAMFYTEDAPTLESAFHEYFDDRRINLVNPRKEFFNVTLDEIVAVARGRGLQAEITLLAEAQEFRQTQARRRNGPAPASQVTASPTTGSMPIETNSVASELPKNLD